MNVLSAKRKSVKHPETKRRVKSKRNLLATITKQHLQIDVCHFIDNCFARCMCIVCRIDFFCNKFETDTGVNGDCVNMNNL